MHSNGPHLCFHLSKRRGAICFPEITIHLVGELLVKRSRGSGYGYALLPEQRFQLITLLFQPPCSQRLFESQPGKDLAPLYGLYGVFEGAEGFDRIHQPPLLHLPIDPLAQLFIKPEFDLPERGVLEEIVGMPGLNQVGTLLGAPHERLVSNGVEARDANCRVAHVHPHHRDVHGAEMDDPVPRVAADVRNPFPRFPAREIFGRQRPPLTLLELAACKEEGRLDIAGEIYPVGRYSVVLRYRPVVDVSERPIFYKLDLIHPESELDRFNRAFEYG